MLAYPRLNIVGQADARSLMAQLRAPQDGVYSAKTRLHACRLRGAATVDAVTCVYQPIMYHNCEGVMLLASQFGSHKVLVGSPNVSVLSHTHAHMQAKEMYNRLTPQKAARPAASHTD